MKRLEDIPKKQAFKVPDGYFDELPMRIQARIAAESPKPIYLTIGKLTMRYALPILFVGIISVALWDNFSSKNTDPIAALDSVPNEQLLAYLEADEISLEEIIENASFTTETVDALHQPYQEVTDAELTEIADDYDFNF